VHAAAGKCAMLDTVQLKSRVILSTTDRAGCDDLSSGSRAVHGVLIHVTQPWRSKLILAF
jgi:hypothetical protein